MLDFPPRPYFWLADLATRRCCMAYFKGTFFVVEQHSVVRRSGGVSQFLKAFMFVVFVLAFLSTIVTVFE